MPKWRMICPGLYEGVPDRVAERDADAAGQDGDGDDQRALEAHAGRPTGHVYPRRAERLFVSHGGVGET